MVIVEFKRPVCCCHFMTGLVPVDVDVLFTLLRSRVHSKRANSFRFKLTNKSV